jgi:hypothetical protein
MHSNITGCIKIEKYYILSHSKLWYMLLGTEFVSLFMVFFRVSQVLGGGSWSLSLSLFYCPYDTDMYWLFSINFL